MPQNPSAAVPEWLTLFQALPQGVLVVDGAGRVLELNPAACSLLGRSRSDLLAGTVGPQPALAGTTVLPAGCLDPLKADGDPRGFEVTAVPLAEGCLLLTFVGRRDAGNRNEELLSKAFDACPMGISIATVEDGRFVAVNESVLAIRGLQRHDLIGHRADELETWADPRDRAHFVDELARHGRIRDFETRLKVASGEYRDFLLSSETLELQGSPCNFNFLLDITERKQADHRLREALEFGDQILRSAQEGIIVYGRDLHYQVWNPFMERLTGLPSAGVLGRHPLTVFPFLRDTGVLELLEAAAGGAAGGTLEMPFRVPGTGRSGWSQHTCAPFRDARGEVVGAIAIVHEITQSRQAAIDLQEREERLRTQFKLASEGIITHDFQGNLIEVNEAFARMHGYAPAEMRRMNLNQLDRPGTFEMLRERLPHLLAGESLTFEVEHLRKDGRAIPLEVSTSLVTAGGRSVILAFHRDITERHRVEAELLRERNFTRALLDSMVEGVVACDERGDLVLFNRTSREWHGMDLLKVPQEQWGACYGLFEEDGGTPLAPESIALARALRGEVVRNAPPTSIRAQGQPLRLMTSNASPILDADGRVLGAVSVQHDVTAQRQSAEAMSRLLETLEARVQERTARLESANAELDAFSYSVSHDLRAPLRSIDGFSEALQEELGEACSPEVQFLLQRVRGGTRRMGQLIHDLLLLSRAGRGELVRQRLDLSAMAQSILDALGREDASRPRTIQVEPGLTASGDPGLVRSILENLLGNAWKYTSKVASRRIEVFREPQPDGVPAFCVQDNGAGFDMEYAGKLFQAFQRLHSTEEFEGTGIGLAIVQRIVHRHGGRVWARGEAGQGAAFRFTLPETP